MRDHDLKWELERGDSAVEVLLRYDIEPYVPARTYGPPEDCYPAEGGCVTDLAAFKPGTSEAIELTDEERAAITEWIEAHHDHKADSEPDPDAAYDQMRDDQMMGVLHESFSSGWDD